MRLVFIEWEDSAANPCSNDWRDFKDCKPESTGCQSVGWLLHDRPDYKVVVPHVSVENDPHTPRVGCGDMTIPTRAIVRIVDLQMVGTSLPYVGAVDKNTQDMV